LDSSTNNIRYNAAAKFSSGNWELIGDQKTAWKQIIAGHFLLSKDISACAAKWHEVFQARINDERKQS
jgi:hypothetical protein